MKVIQIYFFPPYYFHLIFLRQVWHGKWKVTKGAFTPDANEANKSRYSCVIGRLYILSLLASFASEIHYTTDANTRHGRGFLPGSSGLDAKFIPVFVKVRSSIVQLWVPTYNHNYFVLHSCFGFSASACNDVTARASSLLVNATQISTKDQIFQLAQFALRNSCCLVRANSAAGLSIASLHWLNM